MNRHLYTDLLFHACLSYPDLPALHIKRGGAYTTWTFAEFHRDLNRLTSMLIQNGLGKGRTAAVIGENSPEWVIAFHAILLTGACTVPIDPNIPPAEIEEIIAATEAGIVFCSPVYGDLFRSLRSKHRFLREIVLLDVSIKEKEPTLYQYLGGGDPRREAFQEKFSPDDPMVIIFTSGTTGRAKGAVLSQKNYTAVANHAILRMGLGPGDTVLSVLPLHHVFGFAAGAGGPLCGGMGVVFVPYLKGPLIIEALREKGVTMLPAVPKMIALFYESVIHNVRKKGPVVSTLFSLMQALSALGGKAMGQGLRRSLFSSVHKGFGGKLRLIISGGAALGSKYWNGFRRMGFNILEGYGLTETFGPITVCPAGDARLGSVGPALPENEIKISDPDRDGVGEVFLRGSCVFLGYYRNDDLTKEVFDGKGWFHTGDLGRLDRDGFLYIMGRKKDVIVLDTGKNVYPDELENSYEQSQLIEEIGVFGAMKDGSEIVAAAVVPSKEIRMRCTIRQAGDLIRQELVRIGKTLPVHRRIADFVVVYQPLPRTTSRKLKKPELLKIYSSIKRKTVSEGRPLLEDHLSVMETAIMETDEYRSIVESITAVAPDTDPRSINPRTHFDIDLGLDSLHRIELLSAIERVFSLTLPDAVFEKMETIADLVSLVKEQKLESRPTSVERVLDLKERILSAPYVLPSPPTDRFGFLRRTARSIADTARPRPAFNETLPAGHGSCIFVAFHHTASDAPRILRALPRRTAENTFCLSEELRYPWLLYALCPQNMIKMKNSRDPLEAIKISLAVIRSGKNLILFPEGATSPPGRPAVFKPAVGMVALETGAAVVPVRCAGKKVSFGRPLFCAPHAEEGLISPEPSPRQVTERIHSALTEMR